MATAALAKDTKTTSLARFEDVRAVMSDYTPDKYIALIPTVDMERSPLFRPAVLVVPVDPMDKRDVYESPAKDGTVCLRARKAEQIGSAIGVKWHDVKMERTETSVTATVYAEITDAVGDRIPLVAAATEYLTPAKGRTVSTFPEEKAQARARAILVKKLTGLPTSFRPEELKAKSFVGLRWVLDDRQPDIRDAVINRGARAAAQVFGKEAPEKAITATAGPDDLEGEVIDTTARAAEPEIPDDEPKPAFDLAAVRAGLEASRAKLRIHDGKATDQQIFDIGVALRDVLALRDRVEKAKWPDVRLAVLAALWGVSASADLTTRQALATLNWLGTEEGQAAARELFEQISADGTFAAQQTLAGAAEVLK